MHTNSVCVDAIRKINNKSVNRSRMIVAQESQKEHTKKQKRRTTTQQHSQAQVVLLWILNVTHPIGQNRLSTLDELGHHLNAPKTKTTCANRSHQKIYQSIIRLAMENIKRAQQSDQKKKQPMNNMKCNGPYTAGSYVNGEREGPAPPLHQNTKKKEKKKLWNY